MKNKNVNAELEGRGYSVVDVPDTASFLQFSNSIGKVAQTADVQVDLNRKEYKYSAEAIPFHTDNPTLGVIGFFCMQNSTVGGENLLLDVRPLLAKMTAAMTSKLRLSHMKMPNGPGTHPLLSGTTDAPHIFYLPFFWETEATNALPATCEAMLHFHKLVLEEHAAGRYVSIGLSPGQCLFLNNRFILHGRGAIPRDSARHLVRALINV
jgi:hypothetical protein